MIKFRDDEDDWPKLTQAYMYVLEITNTVKNL